MGFEIIDLAVISGRDHPVANVSRATPIWCDGVRLVDSLPKEILDRMVLRPQEVDFVPLVGRWSNSSPSVERGRSDAPHPFRGKKKSPVVGSVTQHVVRDGFLLGNVPLFDRHDGLVRSLGHHPRSASTIFNTNWGITI